MVVMVMTVMVVGTLDCEGGVGPDGHTIATSDIVNNAQRQRPAAQLVAPRCPIRADSDGTQPMRCDELNWLLFGRQLFLVILIQS